MPMIIAGTGHRPNKLGGYGPAQRDMLLGFAMNALLTAPGDVESVISGMALGWDEALASAAHILKIPFVCAVPCEGQDRLWPTDARKRYAALLEAAREVVMVTKGTYHPGKMQRRNEWMVDRATTVLALWNGSSGGTANCVAYAESIGRPVVNLWEAWHAVQ